MNNEEHVQLVFDTIKEMQREKDVKHIFPNYALHSDLYNRLKGQINGNELRDALNRLFVRGKIMLSETMVGKAISAI